MTPWKFYLEGGGKRGYAEWGPHIPKTLLYKISTQFFEGKKNKTGENESKHGQISCARREKKCFNGRLSASWQIIIIAETPTKCKVKIEKLLKTKEKSTSMTKKTEKNSDVGW